MKISTLVFLLFLLPKVILAQAIVSGTVVDQKGMPISGANVYLEGGYDGIFGKIHIYSEEEKQKFLRKQPQAELF